MAITTVPTLETLPKTMYLVDSIDESATSMKINYVPVVMTKGILLVDEGLDTEERIGFDGVTPDGAGNATLANLTRGMSYSASAWASVSANKKPHIGNAATVRLVFAHEYFNNTGFIDRAQTWQDHQTLTGTKEVRFGSSTQAIWADGSGNLTFKDASNPSVTLTTLAAAAGVDTKVRVSSNDTTSGFLNGKAVAGLGIKFTENNDGGNETLTFAADVAPTELTIASGAVTITQKEHTIDTEGNAAQDELDTISGGSDGQIIVIQPDSFARTIILTPNGNIDVTALSKCGYFTLDDDEELIVLVNDGGTWLPLSATIPVNVGTPMFWPEDGAPQGYHRCYGQEVSLSLYRALFAQIGTTYGVGANVANFTADSGTDVLTSASHGLTAGTALTVSNSGGGLPGGLSASTIYYVRDVTTNTFKLAATQHGAAIDITSNGTGTQSYQTTFKVPDMRGRMALTKDNLGGSSANRVTDTEADTIGSAEGQESVSIAHTHSVPTSGCGTQSGGCQVYGPNSSPNNTGSMSANDTPNLMNPYMTWGFVIRF